MTTTAQAPLLLAVSAIDERSRIVIESAGGRVGRASTGDGEGELATLLVRLPESAVVAAQVNDDLAITVSWEGVEYHLHLRSSLSLAEAEIVWGWIDVAEEDGHG